MLENVIKHWNSLIEYPHGILTHTKPLVSLTLTLAVPLQQWNIQHSNVQQLWDCFGYFWLTTSWKFVQSLGPQKTLTDWLQTRNFRSYESYANMQYCQHQLEQSKTPLHKDVVFGYQMTESNFKFDKVVQQEHSMKASRNIEARVLIAIHLCREWRLGSQAPWNRTQLNSFWYQHLTPEVEASPGSRTGVVKCNRCSRLTY